MGPSLPEIEEALPAIRRLYRDEVSYVDAHVGSILNLLDTLGLRDDTLIVVAADHGEELFDHDFFHGHFRSLYQSVLHVPLILSFPERLPANVRVAGVVENIDILPTILATLGQPIPEGVQGRSLLDVMHGGGTEDSRLAFSQREPYAGMPGGRGFAVRDGPWKLISYSDAPDQLFDLSTDPLERHDLSQRHRDRSTAMAARLTAWRRQGFEARLVDRESLDPEALRTLRALGYLE